MTNRRHSSGVGLSSTLPRLSVRAPRLPERRSFSNQSLTFVSSLHNITDEADDSKVKAFIITAVSVIEVFPAGPPQNTAVGVPADALRANR